MRRASGLAAACLLSLVGAAARAQTSEIQDRDDPGPTGNTHGSDPRRWLPQSPRAPAFGPHRSCVWELTTLLEVEFAYMSDHKRGYEGRATAAPRLCG